MFGPLKRIFEAQYFSLRLRPEGLKLTCCCDTVRNPMAKPLSYDALILFPILSIVDEQLKQVSGIRQVVLIVVFSNTEQDRCDEIAMGCRELHHELAAE